MGSVAVGQLEPLGQLGPALGRYPADGDEIAQRLEVDRPPQLLPTKPRTLRRNQSIELQAVTRGDR